MKVKINPYIHRFVCNIHTKYMEKKYGFHWPEEQTKFENFIEKLEDIIQSFYNCTFNLIQDRRKRKIKIHIDDYDVWGMDHTLSLIIYPMLKKLKENKMGAPFVHDEDVPEELRGGYVNPKNGETDSNWFKRWDYVLDEMIFAFKCQTYEWEEEFFDFSDDLNATFDKKGLVEKNDRIQNGLRLFGKYYSNLWD